MLKKDFDIFYMKVTNWLFEKYSTFSIAKAYGAKDIKDIDREFSFMQIEILEYVQVSNKRKSPLLPITVPACISVTDFNEIISNFKTKLL